MRIFLSLFIFSSLFLVSCSQIRESAGVNRKNIDEFKVVENPPLVIPPNLDLLAMLDKDWPSLKTGNGLVSF